MGTQVGGPGGCGGVLGPWGSARPRVVRVRGGGVWHVIPRRSRCGGCGRAHVVLGPYGLPLEGRVAHPGMFVGDQHRKQGGGDKSLVATPRRER